MKEQIKLSFPLCVHCFFLSLESCRRIFFSCSRSIFWYIYSHNFFVKYCDPFKESFVRQLFSLANNYFISAFFFFLQSHFEECFSHVLGLYFSVFIATKNFCEICDPFKESFVRQLFSLANNYFISAFFFFLQSHFEEYFSHIFGLYFSICIATKIFYEICDPFKESFLRQLFSLANNYFISAFFFLLQSHFEEQFYHVLGLYFSIFIATKKFYEICVPFKESFVKQLFPSTILS